MANPNPPSYELVRKARRMRKKGMFVKDIATELGVSKRTIDRWFQKYE